MEGTSSSSTPLLSGISPKKIQKRRFPGPAGLLPTPKPNEFRPLDKSCQNPISDKIEAIISDSTHVKESGHYPMSLSQIQLLSSQDDGIVFKRNIWLTLLQELCLTPVDPDTKSIMNMMNIKWVLTKATKLPSYTNIPFMVAIIRESDDLFSKSRCNSSKSRIKLMDPTGSIEAAVHPDLLSIYKDEFVSGSAVALKNVGTLELKRDIILTITESNIICMTCRTEADKSSKPLKQARTLNTFVTEDEVRVIYLSDFCPEKLLQDYHAMSLPNPNAELQNSDEEESTPEIKQSRRPRLFSDSHSTAPCRNPNKLSSRKKSNPAIQILAKQTRIALVTPQNPIPVNIFEDDDADDELLRALDYAESSVIKVPENSVPHRIAISKEIMPKDASMLNLGETTRSSLAVQPLSVDLSTYTGEMPNFDCQGEMPMESDDEIFQFDDSSLQSTFM